MELNIFSIKLNGGVAYSILSKASDSTELILKLAKSNVFAIDKSGQNTKYLFFDQMVEVQQLEQTNSQKEVSWTLKEK
jgi:hypothetical protein